MEVITTVIYNYCAYICMYVYKYRLMNTHDYVMFINTDSFHSLTHTHSHTHTHTHTHTHILTHTGAPVTFPLSVRPARNFPIDLYLLMDLSFSMNDDLNNLKRLGSQLGMYIGGISHSHCWGGGGMYQSYDHLYMVEHLFLPLTLTLHTVCIAASIVGISTNFTIGFGSFVDKRVGPYVSLRSEVQNDPCFDNPSISNCVPTYSYRHVVSLTPDQDLFDVSAI